MQEEGNYKKVKQSVSRILYQTIIYLGYRLPGISCDLPESQAKRAASSLLFGLAPDGVCRAISVTRDAVSSYLAFSPLPRKVRGGIFSVALSCFSRRLGVTQRPALRSSDFPHPALSGTRLSGLLYPYKTEPLSFHTRILPQISQGIIRSIFLISTIFCGGIVL